ncbi:hypothetical protein NPIL_385281 [Nephila pilipes]|uniref:Uncharacterized protein n=1 Tax=Nephila pilipes TaxID=299642 RepID=A0A8X6QE78_NEPPI|nr:hypothetical protein NPIL_385281 [Nephila pilipes]
MPDNDQVLLMTLYMWTKYCYRSWIRRKTPCDTFLSFLHRLEREVKTLKSGSAEYLSTRTRCYICICSVGEDHLANRLKNTYYASNKRKDCVMGLFS